ncbi:putative phosphoenolpyruvate synthase, partial [Orchesella cincta]
NVESAEMPEDMSNLGNEIIRNGDNFEKFLQASPATALEWLRENDKMGCALDTFFEKHGHRGFAELDVGEPSWESDPISFLPILRNVVKNKLNHKENTKSKVKPIFKNDDELLDSLSSKLKPMTRRLLKWILPTCRNAVAYREKSKSLYVRVMGQFKTGYKYLAQLMVQENLLPSESLIVHLTHYEIGQLVNRDVSSSIILQKAMRRQKMYPFMEKLQFPEINVGMPNELDTSTPVTITNTVQATPVSRGVARGTAKVCLSVEEASENIHPGDILITHGTDIAWSPFFPLLGGVVTELGGLISHGAVVAREYGLPCIVGAVNATKIFKTGDYVILDASKGTISKTQE